MSWGWATQFVRRAGRPSRETGCVPVSVPLASAEPMSHEIHPRSAETPELQKELPGHPIGIASLTFTPDGKKFASAGFDRTLKDSMRRHGAKNADYRGGVTCLYDTQLLGACLHASECGGRSRPGAVRGMPDVPIAPPATGPPEGC